MPLASRNYWIEDATSGTNSALALSHAVPDGEETLLQYLYIKASDNGEAWAWELDRPDGTQVFAGYGAILFDFGINGIILPGTAGADIRLDVAATGASTTSRAFMIGSDRRAQL